MRKTKYTVKPTTQFKKDYKLAMKRYSDISRLDDTIVTFLDLTGKEPKFSKKSSSILSSTSKTYRNGIGETLKVFVSSAEVKKEDYERAVAIIVVKDEPTK